MDEEKRKIHGAFTAPFEETAGIFSDMVIPKQCLKVREGMGNAVIEGLQNVCKDLDKMKGNYPGSKETLKKELLKELEKNIDERYQKTLDVLGNNPLKDTLENLFEKHLKEIEGECGRQKKEIDALHKRYLEELNEERQSCQKAAQGITGFLSAFAKAASGITWI
ncbi:MAG: hypothetical protein ACOYOS_12905 [Syntrophales bacterium]